ncbi:glycine cleavage system aminomethyltransferase GcvT [Novosphingobium sp. JCM 18896]|uniref:glycine cleavage system aminomethyltransferase GcvT n=1 Tax=Novosphingobium sp. JCM 18896 TaxID=2989731 RepID=UPI0022216EF8|nr:glycine cleavage system aminomethyltransferase GcvT [Novosphingobium sp. JCM 18896]MCW1427928.1 glycine cleavage system aminomethyltransferase GcvT [Novosphingobium sp. JCM 18896]
MSEDYDNDDLDAVDPLVLPLDAWHRTRGARMVEFAGYQMPVQYEGIIAEHTWTRENAGLFDVSHMGQLEVSGEGVVAALEALLPGDFAALKPGRQRYSLLLNEAGGVIDDLMVTNRGDHFYVVVNGATKWDDIGHLREHLPDEITLTHLDEHALLALQGPKAAEALGRLGLVPAFDGMPALADLKFMQAGPFLWDGRPLGVSRSGYTGEDGFEISVRGEDVAALADALCAQPEVKPIGLGARDSLRLEAGLPLYGHDLNEETDPISADLGFAISKRRRSEGGFLGAETVLARLAEGTSARRVGLALEGRQAAREGAQVMQGDQQVGQVTSGGFSPSLQRPIAMAYVDAALAAPGTALDIDVRGKRLSATVVPMPFVPHRYHR